MANEKLLRKIAKFYLGSGNGRPLFSEEELAEEWRGEWNDELTDGKWLTLFPRLPVDLAALKKGCKEFLGTMAESEGGFVMFYPDLARALDDNVNATLMLSKLVYWTQRTKDRQGWVYKSHTDWTRETRLGRKAQETARRVLRDKGLVEERAMGTPRTVHYRVDAVALDVLASSSCARKEQLAREEGASSCIPEIQLV